jgi:quercetin dioxygenase-like cupin family protein
MIAALKRPSIVGACVIVVLGLAAVAAAQRQKDPLDVRVVFENSRVRVTQFTSEPGAGVCGLGLHSHPAHLTIALSPARNHVVTSEGKTIENTLKLGDVFWSEAGTHSVINDGKATVRLLILEIK